MTRKHDCICPLTRAGIDYDDALALRRIAMTLHRWHELECGDDRGMIGREDDSRGWPTGRPYWFSARTGARSPIPDRERGALKRLAKIMKRYPSLAWFQQGDPRGVALYILRPGDVPAGERAESYYSRGIAVYR